MFFVVFFRRGAEVFVFTKRQEASRHKIDTNWCHVELHGHVRSVENNQMRILRIFFETW